MDTERPLDELAGRDMIEEADAPVLRKMIYALEAEEGRHIAQLVRYETALAEIATGFSPLPWPKFDKAWALDQALQGARECARCALRGQENFPLRAWREADLKQPERRYQMSGIGNPLPTNRVWFWAYRAMFTVLYWVDSHMYKRDAA